MSSHLLALSLVGLLLIARSTRVGDHDDDFDGENLTSQGWGGDAGPQKCSMSWRGYRDDSHNCCACPDGCVAECRVGQKRIEGSLREDAGDLQPSCRCFFTMGATGTCAEGRVHCKGGIAENVVKKWIPECNKQEEQIFRMHVCEWFEAVDVDEDGLVTLDDLTKYDKEVTGQDLDVKDVERVHRRYPTSQEQNHFKAEMDYYKGRFSDQAAVKVFDKFAVHEGEKKGLNLKSFIPFSVELWKLLHPWIEQCKAQEQSSSNSGCVMFDRMKHDGIISTAGDFDLLSEVTFQDLEEIMKSDTEDQDVTAPILAKTLPKLESSWTNFSTGKSGLKMPDFVFWWGLATPIIKQMGYDVESTKQFMKMDPDKSGLVATEELKGLFAGGHPEALKKCEEKVFPKFNKEKLNLDEFLEMCHEILAALEMLA